MSAVPAAIKISVPLAVGIRSFMALEKRYLGKHLWRGGCRELVAYVIQRDGQIGD